MICSICSDKAEGYHFGAISCAACGAFFRRSVSDQKVYSRSNRQCNIAHDPRKQLQILSLFEMSHDGAPMSLHALPATMATMYLTVHAIYAQENNGKLEMKTSHQLLNATADTENGNYYNIGNSIVFPNKTSKEEGEWIHNAPIDEIEEAQHLLDIFHLDFSETKKPLAFLILIIFVTLAKPTAQWPILRFLPESVVLMFYGVIMGTVVKSLFKFDPGQLNTFLFFMILLPAIVNDAGLSMPKKEFAIAFPKIMLFAVVGTVLHALLLAVTLYGIEPIFYIKPGFLHISVFATLISAVDPVSVLSTFAELDVKKSLFILIFGESMLNDAVTIVLYRTAINVIKSSDASGQVYSFAVIAGSCLIQFLVVCIAGLVIGAIVGIVGVFIMKNMVGHQMGQPVFQLFCPYLAYLFAETGHYSGIFASIMCAAIMSYYMSANTCVEMEFAALTFSKTGSSISQSCIFFYLGVSLVSYNHKIDVYFIIFTVLFCTFYRFIVTCSLATFFNIFASDRTRISFTDQLVSTHAGIRGAVCFGLVQIIDERIIPAKPYFVTTALAMIFVTSILQGCTIKFVMKCLKIPGDDGHEQDDPKAFMWLSTFNDKYTKKFLQSQNHYLPTDGTFRNLALPTSVSTALRIGQRSNADLESSGTRLPERIEMEPLNNSQRDEIERPALKSGNSQVVVTIDETSSHCFLENESRRRATFENFE